MAKKRSASTVTPDYEAITSFQKGQASRIFKEVNEQDKVLIVSKQNKPQNVVISIWSIADLLRGDFKQSEYGKVILPFTVLRRFDCVLAPSKAKILEANKTLTVSNKRPIFKRMTGHDYYNVSQFDFEKLMDDSNAIEANLRDYINGFSEDVREIMDNFEIFGVIDRLSRANLLYLVVQRFAEIDMSDTQIDNLEMGYMFEELIRRFSEQSNETAGEHFTPREVIELMVEVLLDPDMDEIANTDGKVITILESKVQTMIQFSDCLVA